MKRQLINTAALLKICGICAAITFALVANSAQAQTMCPAGQENVRGICQTICSEGQTRVTSPHVAEERNTGCFDNALISILDDCEEAGWDGREAVALYGSGHLACMIPSVLWTGTSGLDRAAADSCYIARGSTVANVSCALMYGDPPVFPKAEDHPTVRPQVAGTDVFIANCDQNGNVPGGYPPDHNLNGETECSCGSDPYIGVWPNCVAMPTLTRGQREGARACIREGWDISTATAAPQCEIPLTSGGTDYDGCFFGESAPRCADVFGAEYAFPDAAPPPLVQSLFNGFNAIAADAANPAHIKTAAGVYRDAVLARYEGDSASDYLAGPLANIEANSDANNITIVVSVLEKVFFTDNAIPFDFDASGVTQAARFAALPGLITAAFAMIPVRQPYVFNCGEGATPAAANPNGATECACNLVSHIGEYPNCVDVATIPTAATGTPTITAAAGIRASIDGVTDVNGIDVGTLQWQWQQADTPMGNYGDIADAPSSDFFAPQAEQVGKYVRACVSFMDELAMPEQEGPLCSAGVLVTEANLVRELRLRLRLFLEGPLR